MKAKILILSIFFLAFLSFTQAQKSDSTSFDEFDNLEKVDSTKKDTSLNSSSDDEFSSDENTESNDEFASDEFSSGDEFSESDEFSEGDEAMESHVNKPKTNKRAYWAIVILLYTLLAGIFMYFKKTRKFRALFLLVALVIFGFYRGGPGVISSFQNTVLLFIGADVSLQAVILFLGLIVITYFFGKVFCGWVCYLGAIQEFLYIGKIKIFQSAKAQKIMKWIRIVATSGIIIQLIITQTIEWSKIGPFKVVLNLYSPNMTGYILLGIVLVSSVFIHRPFCKMICPVGLIHGFVSRIPGASILGINTSCAGCKTCSTSCQINAITRDGKTSHLDNEECIRCGDCMDDCKIGSITQYKNGQEHKNKIVLKGIKKMKI